MQRFRAVVLLAVLALLSTACGARVSDEARDAAAAAAGLKGGNSSQAAGGEGFSTDGSGGSSSSGGGGGGSSSSGGGGSSSGGGGSVSGAGSGGSSSAGSGGGTGGSGGGPAAGPAGGAGGPVNNGGSTDVGVTGNSITLGNVSTLSGPVPGLFQGAAIGAQAFLAYQNSQGGVHGRQLQLQVRDDGFDAGQNRTQTEDLIPKVFGFLGSFSLYDDAGGEAMKKAGVPDVGYGLSASRAQQPNNFSPQPAQPGWRLGPLEYYKKKFPNEIKKVGTIVGNVESAKASWEGQKAAMESLGYEIVYEAEYQPTQTDFTTDVVRMQNDGVEFVMLTAADVKSLARFAKAMQQQNWRPKVFATGGIGYDASLIPLAGSAVEGLLNDQTQVLYLGEDAKTTPEVALFQEWIQRVKPGAKADVFTAFGWASGRLLVQALQAAGPKLTRASATAALKNINNFDSNGLVAPSGPGSKRPATCWVLTEIKDGKYVRKDSPPKGFRCDGGYFRKKS